MNGKFGSKTALAGLSCVVTAAILTIGAGMAVLQSQGSGCTNYPFSISDSLSLGYFPASGGTATLTWSKSTGGSAYCSSFVTSNSSWLYLSPSSSSSTTGSSAMTAQVNPNFATRSATVTVSSSSYDATSHSVSQAAATATQSQLVLTPDNGSAGWTFTSQAFNSSGSSQSIQVTSSGSALSFSASVSTSSGGNWLSVSPTGLSTPGTITLTASAASLGAGTYSGTLTISASGASNSPITRGIQFNVVSAGAASITATAGSGQSAIVNTPFAIPLQATVRDASGAGVSNVSVTFLTAVSGPSGRWGGQSTVTVTTDAAGRATAPQFTANGITGSYVVTAVTGTLNTTFSLTNTLGGLNSLTATQGSGQSANVNTAFGLALQATARDKGGNPVSGVAVTFTAPSSGPSGAWAGRSSITITTDSSGRATAPVFTANGTTGSYSVTASAALGELTVSFQLTNTPAATGIVAPPVVGFALASSTASATTNISLAGTGGVSTGYGLTISYANVQNVNWLTAAPASLQTPAAVAVTANASGLPPGRYLATIAAVSTAANPAPPAQIPVVMKLTAGGGGGPLTFQPQCAWVSKDTPPPTPPGSTSLEQQIGCTYKQITDVTGFGLDVSAVNKVNFTGSLTFDTDTTDWLTATLGNKPLPADPLGDVPPGTTNTTIPITIQADKLKKATQNAFVSANLGSQGGDLALITVVAGPTLKASPNSVSFDISGGAAPLPDTVSLAATGGTHNFTAASSAPWLTVNPATGSVAPGQPVTLSLSVDPRQLAGGTTPATVTIGSDLSSQPEIISVVANVSSTRQAPAITSFFASPASITLGQQSTLNWNVTGADTVTINQGIGAVAASGSRAVAPTTSTTYTLTATNTAGSVSSNATVTVGTQPSSRPVISAGGVVTVAAGTQIMSPLSLVSIYGLNFTNGVTQTWDGATLRSTLAGASVAIDGKPAFPLFVSPTFMNVQVPDTTTRGMVTVTVTNANGTSDPVLVQMADLAPEFKGWSPNPTQVEANRAGPSPAVAPACQAVACPVGPANMLPPFSAPAQPGESISLWALGFGPSNPRILAGLIGVAAPLVNQVQITIGGLAATLPFGGFLQGVGLYQFNVIVPPSLADGEYDVVATVNGVRTLKTMKLTVKR